MLKTKWMWTAVVLSTFLALSGCAREADEKVSEAEQDLEEAWEAEKAAAVEEMRKIENSVSEDLDAIRTRAQELEARGEEAAAEAYHAIADRLEAARDEAAREIRALEQATADTWRAARDSAQEAVKKLEDVWMEEKKAVLAEMNKLLEATSERVAAIRDRAVELEEEGKEAAARAWHTMADRMEAARDAAARDIRIIEEASARGLRKAEHLAADAFYVAIGAAALGVDELYTLESHAAAFLADVKDDFVVGARAAWDKTGEELELAKEKMIAAEQAGEEAVRQEWHEIVTDLENARENAAEVLRRLEEAGEGAWQEEKHGFVEAYHDLRDASARAVERLREA